MKPDLLVLAAGAGSRYGGPKQLEPVGPRGQALLEYSVHDALRAGFGRVVLVVRAETEEAFRRRFDRGMGRRVPLVFVHQRLDDLAAGFDPPVDRVKPWGTGHAVLAAARAVEGPFAVVNADDFYGRLALARLGALLARERSEGRAAAIGFRLAATLSESGPVSRAVLETDAEGRLVRLVELPEVWRQDGSVRARDGAGRELDLEGRELVSMNLWGFSPRVFSELRLLFDDFAGRRRADPAAEFGLPQAVQALIDDERLAVDVLPAGGEWCGLTFRRDHSRVRAALAALTDRGEYPVSLWN